MSKFASRKFLLAVVTAIGGAAIALSSFEGKVGAIAAIISAVVPVVTYIITEGVVDAKAVGLATQAIEEIYEITEDDGEEEDEVQG